MAKPVLTTTIVRANVEINRLENFLTRASGLSGEHQHLIGEVIMLRLFSILEATFQEVAAKLCCGVKYTNGVVPNITNTSKSMDGALIDMLHFNRPPRSLKYLQWTKADLIKKNLQHILDINDPYIKSIDIYSNHINEMRKVRNHIAHTTKKTSDDYRNVIRATYGANLRIKVGAFLMSTKRNNVANIYRYIQTCKVIISEVTRGV